MNKKILIIVVIIVILAAGGFFAYKFYSNSAPKAQQPADNQLQVQVNGVKTEVEGGTGTLTVCQDKCGDGVCQKADPNCKNGMNCICPEASQDCPEDCK